MQNLLDLTLKVYNIIHVNNLLVTVFRFYSEILLQRLNSTIIYDRDFSYNFFGFKVRFYVWAITYPSASFAFIVVACMLQTLERSYLLTLNGKVAERPQHMLMRVAIGIHHEDLDAAIEVFLFIYLSK